MPSQLEIVVRVTGVRNSFWWAYFLVWVEKLIGNDSMFREFLFFIYLNLWSEEISNFLEELLFNLCV